MRSEHRDGPLRLDVSGAQISEDVSGISENPHDASHEISSGSGQALLSNESFGSTPIISIPSTKVLQWECEREKEQVWDRQTVESREYQEQAEDRIAKTSIRYSSIMVKFIIIESCP
jgi:hypothetical protein